jgi:hypothetical protein
MCDAKLVNPQDGTFLIETLSFWQGLQGMLSLTIEEEMTKEREDEMSSALKADLVAISNEPDFARLESRIKEDAAKVYKKFQGVIEKPAESLLIPDI